MKMKRSKTTKGPKEPATAEEKPRCLVEELKLFQNSHLLNQQDPIQQLHIQLNELANKDKKSAAKGSPSGGANGGQLGQHDNGLHLPTPADNLGPAANRLADEKQVEQVDEEEEEENISTVKKGVLWQQQNYDKFHQRLFSRWKKRYFILTTDYLVCFKRSPSKVGHSEMGKFLYTTALSDVTKIEWLKPKKSDKGAIILRIKGEFNLFLWSKDNLDDWMFMISESMERNRVRRLRLQMQQQQQHPNMNGAYLGNDINKVVVQEELYENTVPPNKLEELHNNNNEATVNMMSFKPTIQLEESEQSQVTKAKSATITKYSKSQGPTEAIRSQQQPSPMAVDESPRFSRHTQSHGEDSPKSSASRSSKKPGREPIEREREARERLSSGSSMQIHITGEGSREDKTTRPLDDDVQPSGRGGAAAALSSTSNVIYGSDGDGNDLGNQNSAMEKSPKPKTRRQTGRTTSNNKSLTDSSPTQVKRRKENNLVSKHSDGEGGSGSLTGSTSTPPSPSKCNSGHSSPKAKGNNDDSNNNDNKVGDDKISGTSEQQQQLRSHQRPNGTNLIRRDNSWQSLVSLTRVGRAPAAASSGAAGVIAKQVVQRSLYAQHIMPEGVKGYNNNNLDRDRHQLRQQLISLESTVTPSRGPLYRQLSMGQPGRRLPRALPASEHQSANFDVAPQLSQAIGKPIVPPLVSSPIGNQATSYQQKLLQLQLMHNSNNVDYVRHGDSNYGYGYGYGYGPDLGTAYGYSSMRSNLKSAASEFSFIRPPSSGAHQQSTLPHQPPSYLLERQQPLRSSAAITSVGNSSHQYLVNPVTGERLSQAQSPQQLHLQPQAPLRELPLKPNKKRDKHQDHQNNENQLPKSSSLTSSIASFFRRAFSRRNKKGKRRSKPAESCSSSLGAFDHDGYSASLPIVPSAFSTGSKSVNKQSAGQQPTRVTQQQQQQQQQQQRMVDMIEAFASQTTAAADLNLSNHLTATPSKITPARLGSPALVASQRQQPLLGNQFGSPLHKSNSISTTMGLSGLIDRAGGQQLAMYDNAMLLTGANGNVAAMGGLSPMLVRSSKVASAHLASSMQQHHHHQPVHLDYHQQQAFASPRSSRGPNDPLPRPSSIYGQPSMISSCNSSPVVSRDERRLQLQQQAAALNFGLHRNSCHGRPQPAMQTPIATRLHHHNQIMIKSTQLDTTREVAEDLGSPTAELSGPNVDQQQRLLYERDILQRISQQQLNSPAASARYNSRGNSELLVDAPVSSSPSIGTKLNERQAVVNPILQSPTMNAIYDNHPMVHPRETRESPYSGSHYDNHMGKFHQQADQFPSGREDYLEYARRRAQLEPSSSNGVGGSGPRSFQLTPSHHQQRLTTTEADLLLMASQHHNKPAAIVAPHTPSHHQQLLAGARSPLMSRRSHHQPALSSVGHYQQSPLVSHQTRLEKGMNGVQSTIIGQQQQVVNIAGAPGINLEPALAASLLRGTNIDAYESSTSDRQLAGFGGLNGQNNNSNKTFLVSTRLSKTMASYTGDSSSSPVHDTSEQENHNNSSSRSSVATTSTGTGTNRRSSSSKDDELSSSGSRSINSSSGEGTRTGPRLLKSSHNNNSNNETSGSSSSSTRRGSGEHSRRSSRRSRRQSSSEQSDELPISQLDDKPEERNWITSKLVD